MKQYLSFGESQIKEEDRDILKTKAFISDNILDFYLEYLHSRVYGNDPLIMLMPPPFAQMLKINPTNDMLDDRKLHEKKIIIIPVNDAAVNEFGMHWSLLVYLQDTRSCYKLDSCSCGMYGDEAGLNDEAAEKMAQALSDHISAKQNEKIELETYRVRVTLQDNGTECGAHVLANAEKIVPFLLNGGVPQNYPPIPEHEVNGYRKKILKIIDALKDEAPDGINAETEGPAIDVTTGAAAAGPMQALALASAAIPGGLNLDGINHNVKPPTSSSSTDSCHMCGAAIFSIMCNCVGSVANTVKGAGVLLNKADNIIESSEDSPTDV